MKTKNANEPTLADLMQEIQALDETRERLRRAKAAYDEALEALQASKEYLAMQHAKAEWGRARVDAETRQVLLLARYRELHGTGHMSRKKRTTWRAEVRQRIGSESAVNCYIAKTKRTTWRDPADGGQTPRSCHPPASRHGRLH